jgi:exodeoxyribonuclease V alpha subunit
MATTELVGTFSRERNRFPGDAIVGELEDGTTVVGKAVEGDLVRGLSYRFFGNWTKHYRYGNQFRFTQVVKCEPHSRRGVVTYLEKYAPWIGPSTAGQLYDAFGQDAVQVLRTEPDRAAAAVKRLTPEHASEAAESLTRVAYMENCKIDLLDLFAKRGFPKTLIDACIQKWGPNAPDRIKRDPYVLLTNKLPGCGFKRTDRMYLELGKKPSRLKRQAICAWHAINSDTCGNTWHSVGKAVECVEQNVAGTELRTSRAIEMMMRAGWMAERVEVTERGDRVIWVADKAKAQAEEYVANRLKQLTASGQAPLWPVVSMRDGLSFHQADRLLLALDGPVGVLAGTPGTGKTYTAASLIKRIVAEHGEGSVAVAAPTGKAAVRCAGAMQRYGLKLDACTIHRLLGVQKQDQADGGGWRFVHNEDLPLPFKFVVIDETSMLDTDLAASLLAACQPGTHVLFIGDPYQLAPVGHGAPLRDLIAAGLPYGELSEIHRNAGDIVRACAAIKNGVPWQASERIDLKNGANFKHIERDTPEEVLAALSDCIGRLAEKYDPIFDVQVLVAVNAKSQLSRHSLNRVLQEQLNRTGRRVDGNPFRVGDKLIVLKNSMFPAVRPKDSANNEDADPREFVANGEVGRVIEITPTLTTVALPPPDRVVKIPVSKAKEQEGEEQSNATDVDLAYAITTHKSQGSGFPVTIIVLDDYPGAAQVASREWVYTAISRAEKLCITIGKKATADTWCRRVSLKDRKTFLTELLKGAA